MQLSYHPCFSNFYLLYFLQASQLGLACLASSLSPDEGLTVFKELQKARQCFVLENELHIIYQVVPIYAGTNINIDWTNYLTLWESLSDDMKRVGQLVGVEERFLVRAMRGNTTLHSSQFQSLCLTKNSSETLQNLPYYI